MKNTLIIYEHPVALYDVYHWIDRFKEKIKEYNKSLWCERDYFNITIDNNGNESIIIISFEHLLTNAFKKEEFDKIVVVGRIPIENKKLMNELHKLLY